MELEATITSSDEPDSLQYTKELFSFPVPDAGIEVEDIFKLGAILSYDVGVSSSFSGSATIDFGLQAGMPDSAQVTADIQNPGSSSATGWSGGSLTPLFDIKQESASVKLAAFSQPKLAFGIELVEVGTFDVALAVKLPEVSVTLTAAYDEDGVCGAGSSKTGVKLDSEVDIGVDLEIDANFGDDEKTANASWSHTLYAYAIPLESLCFPLDIPGLDSSSSANTSGATLPASTSRSVVSTTGISSPVLSSAVDSVVGVDGTPYRDTTSDGSVAKTLAPVVSMTTSKRLDAVTTSKRLDAVTTPKRLDAATTPKLLDAATTSKHLDAVTASKRPDAATPTTAASGGGGCRMVKRFGKRMLVC